MKNALFGAAAMAATLYAYPATAQSWSPAQTEVWQAVSNHWANHVEGSDWHEVMTADSYGWGGSALLPRSRDQFAASARVFGAEGKILHYELNPLAITARDDVAVVHYMAMITEEDHKGEREFNVERCSDVMVRESGGWKFLGWGCADMSDDD
ncbi:nuclear transport factor 2 family protein [Sphingomicrobium arenosum]|uniref:nuclear transport factor 2 family protein n=1 Tax=Sphingomicrobium arenosum TaxID=2233861 RepID=UPI002240F9F2|nr:nuclear transport factor 2 family protein [Sphingomicrobium arenosum]